MRHKTNTQQMVFLLIATTAFSLAAQAITTGSLASNTASLTTSQLNCYEFIMENTPAAEEHLTTTRKEVWCYNQLNSASEKTFIFNADHNPAKPELSMILDQRGVITHGSLLQGNLTVHKVKVKDYNPFGIPMEEPIGNKKLKPMFSTQLPNYMDAYLYLKDAGVSIQEENLTVDDPFSELNSAAVANYQPWRGFWWPRKGMGILVPLAKYDSFVAARTGFNPGAVAWENQNHPFNGVGWSGHCNGWAAAAILRSEPRAQKTDPVSSTIFSVNDQKGLLAEADYCVSATIFGKRNRGAGNNGDIQPQLLHKTLQYYIGVLKKPIAFDYHSGSPVENHIISGYQMQISKIGANRYRVTTVVKAHSYDNSRSNVPGPAPTYTRTYKYYLTTDAGGVPVSGSWISGNPDFLWMPLSTGNCQKLDEPYLSQILNL